MRIGFLLIFLIVLNISFGQEMIQSENIGDCFGAVTVKKHDVFKAQFTGKAGYNNDVQAYQNSISLLPFNTFWLNFESSIDGQLSMTFKEVPDFTDIVLFTVESDSGCYSIHNGTAKIESYISLGKDQHKGVISISTKKGFKNYIYINTKAEGSAQFTLTTAFSDQRSLDQVEELRQVQDLREDRMEQSFSVHIVDSETNLPIEATIVVKNTKSFNALYAANVMRFPDSEYLSFDLEINAAGYFFKDATINRRKIKEDSIAIQLRPVKTNDQIELEGLQFESESDVLLESAKSKIRRLRDFLALNKDVNIEVIGHVHKEGRNTWRAKHLSKKRAKRVKAFLVDSGIEDDRISTSGLGNAEMKFPEPENDKQIQANRRVEIKIK